MINKKLVQTILSLDLQTLTQEQQTVLANRHHSSVCYTLQCAKFFMCGEPLYVFAMPSREFGSFEYYFGMEYERENIVAKIQTGDGMVVAYNNYGNRAVDIWNFITGENDQSAEEVREEDEEW